MAPASTSCAPAHNTPTMQPHPPPIPTAGVAGVLEAVAWGALVAVAILVIVALQASFSWGLYSGF